MTGSDIRKLLSQNIKYFREIRRLSQADLAYEANISIPFLSDIERGNKWPHPDTLASIATATELSDLDQKLQAFYHYLQEGVVESELARTISESITTLKNNSLERRHYMTWAVKMADARYDGYDEGYEKGISIGLTTGREEGREEGISIGLERGAYQNKLETARSLLSEGLDPQMVARCTSLPLETVLELGREVSPEP